MGAEVRALVLGAGRVGRAVAFDLAAEPGWRVTAADRSAGALAALSELAERAARGQAPVATQRADVASPETVARLARDHDLVVGALPSALGFAALSAVIEAGRPYVDISFFAEDPFTLDALARERGVTAVVDCGIAPGCDNLILGRLAADLDRVDRFVCHVGGLPAVRRWPWEYKAPFGPDDVLAEYTRPARWVEAGEVVARPALSALERLEVPGVGTLESFATDGLRTLLVTQRVPHMEERTLRYPGHADRMRALAEAGFFSTRPIAVDGVEVAPLLVTSRLLFEQWRLDDGEEDLTVMRVVVDGSRNGRRERHTFDLLDRRDPVAGLSSMARTSGFTCAAIARRVAEGTFSRQGISAPEHLGTDPACYRRVMDDLARRGVRFRIGVEMLPDASPA